MAIPLLIDTDPGVDDAYALALAARSPEVDLVGVTTVFGNVNLEHTTRNAQRILALLGHDAPVARGAEKAIGVIRQRDAAEVHGDDGLSGLAHTLPESTKPLDPRDAVTFMRDVLESSEQPVTIAAIGPLTNIAQLKRRHPEAAAKIGRLIVMGGGIKEGNVTPKAEFNFWSDADAAHEALALNPTIVPIDLTRRTAVDGAWLDALKASGPLGQTLESLTSIYREYYLNFYGKDGVLVHDAVAVAEAIRPGILRTEPHLLAVDCSETDDRGAVVSGSHQVGVATDADLDELLSFLMNRLARTPGS